MEYKWYLIKIDSTYERHVRELMNRHINYYFKEIFIPYQKVGSSKSNNISELFMVYAQMHLCSESKNILNQIPGFSTDDSNSFKLVSDDEMSLMRKEFDKYKWYILRVASNYEEKACQYVLENSVRLGFNEHFKEIYLPYEEPSHIELRSNKKAVARKKCFPGYIFLYINLCDEVLNFVNNMPKSLKVYGFLKDGNTPKVISNDEICSMRNALYDAQETKKLCFYYEKGERVKIRDGLFQNFIGKVDMINDERKIINVEVSILGKPTVIELDVDQVEKTED